MTALHRAKANWKVDYRKIHPVRAFLPIGVRVSADMWENDDDDDHWIHTLQKKGHVTTAQFALPNPYVPR